LQKRRKVKGCLELLIVTHFRAAERNLPCGITQCDTDECTMP